MFRRARARGRARGRARARARAGQGAGAGMGRLEVDAPCPSPGRTAPSHGRESAPAQADSCARPRPGSAANDLLAGPHAVCMGRDARLESLSGCPFDGRAQPMTLEQRFVPSTSEARKTPIGTGAFMLVATWGFALALARTAVGLSIAAGVSVLIVALIAFVIIKPRPMVTVVLRPTTFRLEGERVIEISLSSIEQAWFDAQTNSVNFRHASGVDAIPLGGFPKATGDHIVAWFRQSLGERFVRFF